MDEKVELQFKRLLNETRNGLIPSQISYANLKQFLIDWKNDEHEVDIGKLRYLIDQYGLLCRDGDDEDSMKDYFDSIFRMLDKIEKLLEDKA